MKRETSGSVAVTTGNPEEGEEGTGQRGEEEELQQARPGREKNWSHSCTAAYCCAGKEQVGRRGEERTAEREPACTHVHSRTQAFTRKGSLSIISRLAWSIQTATTTVAPSKRQQQSDELPMFEKTRKEDVPDAIRSELVDVDRSAERVRQRYDFRPTPPYAGLPHNLAFGAKQIKKSMRGKRYKTSITGGEKNQQVTQAPNAKPKEGSYRVPQHNGNLNPDLHRTARHHTTTPHYRPRPMEAWPSEKRPKGANLSTSSRSIRVRRSRDDQTA